MVRYQERRAVGILKSAPNSAPAFPPEAVREELARVLESREFSASKRSQDFLRHVVEHTLSGQAESLKERNIGVDVFGRSNSYDPSDDATVRVKAGEVRKRLGLYYAGDGASNEIRIDLPLGAYVPEFRAGAVHRVTVPAASPVTDGSIAPGIDPSRRSWRNLRLGIVLAAVAAAAVLFGWWKYPVAKSATEQFWAPVLIGAYPVSLCAEYVPVYSPRRDPISNLAAKPDQFVLLEDQFVGGGDLIAVSRLASMLTRMDRRFQVRVGNTVSFEDLRSKPAVLIGYSYTRWKEISAQMRYFIDGSGPYHVITDGGKPTNWILRQQFPITHTTEDYAIVSRLFHPQTHAMLVELAGITQYGTDAAADLVTNDDLLAQALHGHQGWQTKNLQLVLQVKVMSGVPASPVVLAVHLW